MAKKKSKAVGNKWNNAKKYFQVLIFGEPVLRKKLNRLLGGNSRHFDVGHGGVHWVVDIDGVEVNTWTDGRQYVRYDWFCQSYSMYNQLQMTGYMPGPALTHDYKRNLRLLANMYAFCLEDKKIFSVMKKYFVDETGADESYDTLEEEYVDHLKNFVEHIDKM